VCHPGYAVAVSLCRFEPRTQNLYQEQRHQIGVAGHQQILWAAVGPLYKVSNSHKAAARYLDAFATVDGSQSEGNHESKTPDESRSGASEAGQL